MFFYHLCANIFANSPSFFATTKKQSAEVCYLIKLAIHINYSAQKQFIPIKANTKNSTCNLLLIKRHLYQINQIFKNSRNKIIKCSARTNNYSFWAVAWSYFGFVELDPAHEPVEDLDVAVDRDVHIIQLLTSCHLPNYGIFQY